MYTKGILRHLLMTVSLILVICLSVPAQWEPTGKLQRKEMPVDPRLDLEIITARPTRLAADNTGTVAITFQKEV